MRKICFLVALFAVSYSASAQRKVEVVESPVQNVQDDEMVLKRKVAMAHPIN